MRARQLRSARGAGVDESDELLVDVLELLSVDGVAAVDELSVELAAGAVDELVLVESAGIAALLVVAGAVLVSLWLGEVLESDCAHAAPTIATSAAEAAVAINFF